MIFKPYFMYRNAKTPKAEGTSITLWKAASGTINTILVKGKSEVISGSIKSVGDPEFDVINLGTLTWTYNSTDGFFVATSPANSASPKSGGYNCLSTKYSTYTGNMTNFKNSDTTIWFNPSNIASSTKNVAIRDTSYGTDINAFRTAISGVMLYYPLASPASALLGIVSRNGIAKGTAATITTALPLRSITDDIYDKLTNNSVIKMCGEVDLGDFTWTYHTNNSYFYATMPDDSISNIQGGRDCLCSKYATYKGNMAGFKNSDNTIWINATDTATTKRVCIRDTSAGTDASSFKTAVTGEKLIYPLNDATTTSLTGAEITALASLNTYLNKTEIDNTHNAEMIITYNRTI